MLALHHAFSLMPWILQRAMMAVRFAAHLSAISAYSLDGDVLLDKLILATVSGIQPRPQACDVEVGHGERDFPAPLWGRLSLRISRRPDSPGQATAPAASTQHLVADLGQLVLRHTDERQVQADARK